MRASYIAILSFFVATALANAAPLEYKNDDFTYKKYYSINTLVEREIILHLLKLKSTLKRAIDVKQINELSEYIYKLTSLYNNFYNDNYIISEENETKKESWAVLSDLVLKTNLFILNILAIDVPDKM